MLIFWISGLCDHFFDHFFDFLLLSYFLDLFFFYKMENYIKKAENETKKFVKPENMHLVDKYVLFALTNHQKILENVDFSSQNCKQNPFYKRLNDCFNFFLANKFKRTEELENFCGKLVMQLDDMHKPKIDRPFDFARCNLTIGEIDSVSYLAGFFLRKAQKEHKCQFLDVLMIERDDEGRFAVATSSWVTEIDHGGLIAATDECIDFMREIYGCLKLNHVIYDDVACCVDKVDRYLNFHKRNSLFPSFPGHSCCEKFLINACCFYFVKFGIKDLNRLVSESKKGVALRRGLQFSKKKDSVEEPLKKRLRSEKK